MWFRSKQSSSAIVVSVDKDAGIVLRWFDDTAQEMVMFNIGFLSVCGGANGRRFLCQSVQINLTVFLSTHCGRVGESGGVEAGRPLVALSPANCTTLCFDVIVRAFGNWGMVS